MLAPDRACISLARHGPATAEWTFESQGVFRGFHEDSDLGLVFAPGHASDLSLPVADLCPFQNAALELAATAGAFLRALVRIPVSWTPVAHCRPRISLRLMR
jgi:hypothetical protein